MPVPRPSCPGRARERITSPVGEASILEPVDAPLPASPKASPFLSQPARQVYLQYNPAEIHADTAPPHPSPGKPLYELRGCAKLRTATRHSYPFRRPVADSRILGRQAFLAEAVHVAHSQTAPTRTLHRVGKGQLACHDDKSLRTGAVQSAPRRRA